MIPLSTTFCADDADVIIRADDALDFRVHKCNLSFVSPIFEDMFAIPQPPTRIPDVLPHVDVRDPPGAWENVLRTIYPMPNPTINSLDDLESLLLTAKKYEMQFVIDSYIQNFENQVFIREDPLRLYAIACASGLEEQAKHVASHAELSTVVARSSVSDLKCLTWDSYHRLVSFLARRDKEWNRVLPLAPIRNEDSCKCFPRRVFGAIKEGLGILHLSMDVIYLTAMERSSTRCTGGCVTPEINSIAAERAELCRRVMW